MMISPGFSFRSEAEATAPGKACRSLSSAGSKGIVKSCGHPPRGLVRLCPVRAARFFALACLAGGLAGSVPSLGLSGSAPDSVSAQQACGRLEFISGLEAVFGRRKTHQQALAFRTQVTARGFVNANIIEGCDGFRVVVRGIDTFDVGVDLQNEARREGFAVTLECIQAKPLGRLEAIFGHGRDRPTAMAIVTRAEAA